MGLEGNPLLAGAVRKLTIFAFTKSFLVFELRACNSSSSSATYSETNRSCRTFAVEVDQPRTFPMAGRITCLSATDCGRIDKILPFSRCSVRYWVRIAKVDHFQSLTRNRLDDSTATTLCDLSALRVLELVDPNEHTGEWDPDVQLKAQTLQTLINVHGGCMTRISLPGRLASEVNILRSAHSLTHLFISRAGSCKGLDLFLQHAEELRSLIVTDCKTLSFLPTGRGANDALPALCDLKLVLSLPTTRSDPRAHRDFLADSQILLAFTTIHTDLQRFDFSIEPALYFELGSSQMHRYDNDKWFPNIVKAVCKIEAATALGISFPKLSQPVLDKALADIYEDGISWRCTALRMAGVAEASYSSIVSAIFPCGKHRIDIYARRPKTC